MILRFAGADWASGAIVRQTRVKRTACKIRFDMRLYWHCLWTAQLPPRSSSSLVGRDSVEPGWRVAVQETFSPGSTESHPTHKAGTVAPIFLLRRALPTRYSSRACFVFGFLRSRRSPVCSSFSLPANVITSAKCPSCKREHLHPLAPKGKKSIRACRRRARFAHAGELFPEAAALTRANRALTKRSAMAK